MPKKKNPRDMTSEELVKHLFHPKAVQHVKKLVKQSEKRSMKKV
jgi:hypothetical protein